MAKTGIKTVTVTGVSRFFLDGEKARVRRETEEEFAVEGKEIIGYTEALPATFLGLLTQDISFTWRQSDEKKLSSVQRTEDRVTVTAENYRSILDRIDLFLEDKEWERASAYCEAALDYAARDPEVYVRYLMADLKAGNRKELANCSESFENNENYKKAIRFGSEKLASELNGFISQIKERNRNKELASLYIKAVTALNNAKTEEEYKSAAALFDPVLGFQDAVQRKQECLDNAENSRKDRIYNEAILSMSSSSIKDIEEAIRKFQSINDWKYSKENIEASYELIKEIKEKEELERKAAEKTSRTKRIIISIATPLLVAGIAFGIVFAKVIRPKQKLTKAIEMLDTGDYEKAYSLLEELGEKELIVSNKNERAEALISSGDYDAAYELYRETGNWSAINSSKYERAVASIESEEYKEAYLLLYGLNYKDSKKLLNSIKNEHGREVLPFAQVGSYVFFGTYEQDNDPHNGKEDIEWLVLEKDSNKMLLISRYILDVKEYDKSC